MPIEITGQPFASLTSSRDGNVTQVGRQDQTVAQQQTGRSSAQDTVTFTDSAARLKQLEKGLRNLPVIDPQRVEQTQRTLLDGTFDFDPARVVDKLVEFEQTLNHARLH